MLRNIADRNITATDFRRLLKKITDRISRAGGAYRETRKGKPWMVVLNVETYEALLDERLAESPSLQKRIAEARTNYQISEGASYEALRRELLSAKC